jgi:hypothetical protein
MIEGVIFVVCLLSVLRTSNFKKGINLSSTGGVCMPAHFAAREEK